jgi:AraC-like DNA-binding protein
VAYLRLRRAAELLATTEHTVGAIAQQVGYQNAFVFSNAFTKWIGWRPSQFRRKQHGVGSDAFTRGCHSLVGFEQKPNKSKPESSCVHFESTKRRQSQ